MTRRFYKLVFCTRFKGRALRSWIVVVTARSVGRQGISHCEQVEDCIVSKAPVQLKGCATEEFTGIGFSGME